MNGQLRSAAKAWGLILSGLLVLPLAGCRGGVGSSCLTDSDCEMGLICVKRTETIDGERYEELNGSCHRDPDEDSIPADGNKSGSEIDRRCGVHVTINPETGAEQVYEQVIGECDDNCPDVSNSRLLLRFVCMAEDDCCPASDDEKEKADRFDQCADITDQQDTCAACFVGEGRTPEVCYLSFAEGYDLDDNGCIRCRPASDRMPCDDNDDCDQAVAAGDLPTPACSGKWGCSGDYCKFSPERVRVQDEDGYTVLWQLDSDFDGVGDSCDNCPNVPNGIECDNPLFEQNCDANEDGLITPQELAWGGQANADGDRYGDACDLCPNLADDDNRDLDNDGKANPCDNDDDGDGICDPGISADDCTGSDNCPEVWNPDQRDLDGDGKGDACDADADGDGIREDGDQSGVAGDNPCTGGQRRQCDDNCPETPNPDQADSDGDGVGDACE